MQLFSQVLYFLVPAAGSHPIPSWSIHWHLTFHFKVLNILHRTIVIFSLHTAKPIIFSSSSLHLYFQSHRNAAVTKSVYIFCDGYLDEAFTLWSHLRNYDTDNDCSLFLSNILLYLLHENVFCPGGDWDGHNTISFIILW